MEHQLCLKDIPKELQLMLALLKLNDINDMNVIDERLLRDVDWDNFIALAMHHRAYPLLHSKFKRISGDGIPPHVVGMISNQYRRNTFQMLYLSAEMERISKLFAGAEIPLLHLKGPALAHDLYGDVSLRTSSDLDMLISIDQLAHAEEILINQGYEKDDYIKTVLNDWKWRHHHITFIHPEKKVKVEIHWRLNPGPGKEPDFQALWERKRISTLTSYPTYILSKEDLCFFLVSHGSRHGWSRLRWLLDVKQLFDKELDLKEIRNSLKSFHYFHVGGQSLILASQLLDMKPAPEMKSLYRNKRSAKLAQQAIFYLKEMVSLHIDPVPKHISIYHKQHLYALMSFRHKLIFILSFLYPYPEDRETMPLPTALHFLYFPLRPFLWIWRKTRKHALSQEDY